MFVVLDVGKTLTKLTLWDEGALVPVPPLAADLDALRAEWPRAAEAAEVTA